MKLTQILDGATARIHVAGNLEYGHSAALVDAVAAVLRPGVQAVRLDLTDLAFCDSVGLSALLKVHRLTASAGARLHLDNRPTHLDRVLELTGLLEYLTAATPEQSEIG
ncbi:STAS domain-containing protein [Mycolicibacterium phlei]